MHFYSLQYRGKETCYNARVHTDVRSRSHYRAADECLGGRVIVSPVTQIKALTWLAFCQQEGVGVLPPQFPARPTHINSSKINLLTD